jgi:acetyl-CoA acetyltransferase
MSIEDLAFEAAEQAMRDANTEKVDAIIVANAFSGVANGQENLAAHIASNLGMARKPSFKIELEGASGGAALVAACSLLNRYDRILLIGVEKLSDVTSLEDISSVVSSSINREHEGILGATVYSHHALMMREYMRRYKLEERDFGHFPIMMHENAINVPHAQLRFKVSMKEYIESPYVSTPLKLMDIPSEADGAAAIILSRSDGPVKVAGIGFSGNEAIITHRVDSLDLENVTSAFNMAMQEAGIGIKDLDFIQIHDTSSVLAYLQIESLGLSDKGKAARDTENGKFRRDGEIPINPEGGMKARGYPVGASGIYQLAESYMQLKGAADGYQIQGAKNCAVVSLGGLASSCIVAVLRR